MAARDAPNFGRRCRRLVPGFEDRRPSDGVSRRARPGGGVEMRSFTSLARNRHVDLMERLRFSFCCKRRYVPMGKDLESACGNPTADRVWPQRIFRDGWLARAPYVRI